MATSYAKHRRRTFDDDDLCDWDPMSTDFNDPEFNSYVRGPGRKLETQFHHGDRRLCNITGFNLYVKNIPKGITQDILYKIFSRCGNVISATIPKAHGSKPSIGFVMYKSLREAETAIREISGAPPFNLHVEFSESEADKQIRQMKTACYSDEQISSSPSPRNLTFGRGRMINHSKFNGVNPQKIYAEYCEPYRGYDSGSDSQYEGYFQGYDGGPFESTYKLVEPLISVDGSGGRRVSQGRGFFKIEREEVNYKVQNSKERSEKIRNAVGPHVMEKISIFENDSKIDLPRNYIRERCVVCSALTNSVCSCESLFYCSRDCQVKDWPKHRSSCKLSLAQEKSVNHEESNKSVIGVNKLRRPHENNLLKHVGVLDEKKKQTFHKANDTNERTRFNKVHNKEYDGSKDSFKNKKFLSKRPDEKGRQSFGSSKNNSCQKSFSNEENWDENRDYSKNDSYVPPPTHRTVAESIKASTQQAFKNTTFASEDCSSAPTSKSLVLPPVKEAVGIQSIEKISPAKTVAETSVSQLLAPKKLFFTPGVPIKVIKQHVVNDNEFYVLKKEDLDSFGNLFLDLNWLITDSSPSASPIALKLKCAVKYENEWYRAKVTSLEPIKVFFVDYGNDEIVNDPSEIKILPEKFCSVQPYVARVCFTEGELEDIQWQGEEIEIIAMSKQNDKWFVKLAKNEHTSCSQLLPSETSLTVVDDQQPSTITESEKSPGKSLNENLSSPVKSESINDEPSFLLNKKVESESVNDEPSFQVNKQVDKTYTPKELDPNLNLLKDVQRTWKGSHIIEDITFDSQLLLMIEELVNERTVNASAGCRTIPYLEKLLKSLFDLADVPLDPTYRPKCGEMVGVKNINNDWVRAVVSSISTDGSYNVYLPDKGKNINSVKEVKKLPKDVASYPHLAVTVRFHEDLNGNLSVGSLLDFSLKGPHNDGWIGKIKVEETDENGKVKTEEIAASIEAWEPEYVNDDRLKCVTFDSQTKVFISSCHDANNFYIKPVTVELIDMYDNLSQEVAAHCLTAEPLANEPALGDLVAAKWTVDDGYYRAQVLKRQKNGKYRVIFVDFGNLADIDFHSMKQLSKTLKEIPCSAVRIGLKDVPMKPFTNLALEFIHPLMEGEDLLTAEFETLSAVKLVCSDGTILNDKLCELMVPGWLKAKAEGTDPSGGLVLRRKNLALGKPLPENETVELAVLNILPFSDKNIQFLMFDPASDVFKHVSGVLSKQIENYCDSLPSDDRYVPRTGELCIAKFAEDGYHYRAECVKGRELCATVLFIDYGNLGEVPYQDIHKMPSDFISTPAMALLCNLKDIPYSEEIFKKLRDLVELGDKYDVKILKMIEDEYDVNIPAVTEQLKAV